MRIDELKAIVEDDIQRTKEYGDYLMDTMKPLLTEDIVQQAQCLHFFNLGYKMALERILDLMKIVKESND